MKLRFCLGFASAFCLAACSSSQPTGSSQPRIQSFSAVPSEINPGDAITFTWEITGQPEHVDLCTSDAVRYPELTFAGEICQTVSQVGTLVITTPATVRDTLTFSLSASLTPLEFQEVQIRVRCPDHWFFNDPPDYCPASAAVSSAGISQRFEHGYMFQVEALREIFVLFDEDDPASANPSSHLGSYWSEVRDPWYPGMLEIDPDLSPPSGYYQPRRGMGLVWRTDVNQWRDELGWAVAPEVEYRVTYQRSARLKYGVEFLSGPDGEIIALGFPGALSWSFWSETH